MPFHLTVSAPASAAPIRPPISACDEDDGRPKYQVPRFHAIAPSNAASTRTSPALWFGGAMMPLPTVRATSVETRATATITTTRAVGSNASGLLDRDGLDRVGDVLQRVSSVLESVGDLAQLG